MNGPLEPMLFWEDPVTDIPATEWEEYNLVWDGDERRRLMSEDRIHLFEPWSFLPPWGVE
ncbi:MAG: hypothetical protein VB086_08015 [Clostridiaceae bacterium]|nr:hypothetical protein [Clostridiaceae bacterium]